ncbi:hypothetical protein [Streptomyces sp. NPDC059564]|uniref:hypothetical protein n=1 Tax=Streptomyces sp. NPDC059564 TaxID=3346865 RepID=UPI00369035A7
MSTDTAARLSLIDLFLLGDLIAERLGAPWTKADDSGDAQSVEFHHTAGHSIGIRRLWDGIGAQAYLTVPNAPRYNAGVVFSDSEGASDTLINAIEQRLLPALDGHRPKLGGKPAEQQEPAEAQPPAGEPTTEQPGPPPAETTEPAAPAPAFAPKKAPTKPKTAALRATKTASPARSATPAKRTTARRPKTAAATA